MLCAAPACSPAAVVSYSISPMGGNVANMLLPVTLRDRGFLVLPGARTHALTAYTSLSLTYRKCSYSYTPSVCFFRR